MSDLGDFKLEDIVWEFGVNDEHIVPHSGEKKSGCLVERDCSKRPRTELKCAERDADGHITDNIIGRNEEVSFKAVKQGMETMLEKSSWSHSSNGRLSASLDDDSNRTVSCTTSDEKWTSKQCLRSSTKNSVGDFCASNPALGDQSVHHQLNNGSHTENDLAFFGNGLEGKDSEDLLFYGWPDLENFEDVDDMFRDCDSTFGLELDGNDDMSWFSSSHAIGGCDDALKSSFELSGCEPCGPNAVTEQEEIYGLSNNGLLATESVKKLKPVSCKTDSQNSTTVLPSNVMNSYANEFAAVAHSDTQSQMHSHVSPSEHQKSSEEKRNDPPLEDGVSFIQFDKLNDGEDANYLLNPQHSFLPENGKQRDISHQTGVQMPMPIVKPSSSHLSNHFSPSLTPCIMKSEGDGLSSITPRDSSHESSQMQSAESFHEVSVQNPSSGNKKKGRHHHRRLARNYEKANIKAQRAASVLNFAKKPICSSENEAEGQSEVDGNDISVPGELDSCNMQESSCMSSVVDEVSVNASSLQQLQHVMEQLDIRTKLCIRDSLYRLAKSAEQRHKCFNQTSGRADDNGANRDLLSDGTNKCAGFMDMETDTNPIDRSIAHLLFHRPSDPSAAASATDSKALKAHTMVLASNHEPLTSDKPVYGEETTSTNEEAVKLLKCDNSCAN